MHIELGVGNKAGKNEIDFLTCFEVSVSFFGVSILIPSFGNLSPSFGSFSTVSVYLNGRNVVSESAEKCEAKETRRHSKGILLCHLPAVFSANRWKVWLSASFLT